MNRDVAIKIYFSSMRTGQYQVWKASVSGGDPVQVTRDGGWVSFESADGRDLYFTTTPMARTALWRIPSAGGQAVKVLDEVMNQSFAPVSRGIYYIDQPAAEARLRFHDIDRRYR